MVFTKFNFDFFSKCRNFTRGINSKKKKKIRACYYSMRNPYMKFQDDISFRNITVAKFQCPKFTKRAITQKILYDFFFQFYSSSPIIDQLTQVLRKFLALILFEILHLQNVIPCFSKGPYFTSRDNSDKNMRLYEESIHYVSRRYIRCPIHTDKPKPICSPLFQS